MKEIYLFCFILIATLASCQKRQSNVQQADLDTLRVELTEVYLSGVADSIDLSKISRLTKADYVALQLYNVEGLGGYEVEDLSMGRVLFSNEMGKILTVHVITDGEITEYLLSYDKDGKLQDNLLVAYEDMVEYYREVSSKIEREEIIVQTVEFSYEEDGEDGIQTDKSDTVLVKYKITPEFRFVAN